MVGEAYRRFCTLAHSSIRMGNQHFSLSQHFAGASGLHFRSVNLPVVKDRQRLRVLGATMRNMKNHKATTTSRVEGFNDGVVAMAITLLVLECLRQACGLPAGARVADDQTLLGRVRSVDGANAVIWANRWALVAARVLQGIDQTTPLPLIAIGVPAAVDAGFEFRRGILETLTRIRMSRRVDRVAIRVCAFQPRVAGITARPGVRLVPNPSAVDRGADRNDDHCARRAPLDVAWKALCRCPSNRKPDSRCMERGPCD
jgi:hypothetical protein